MMPATKPSAADAAQALRLMREVVRLCEEKWPSEQQFSALVDKEAAPGDEARIAFLTGFRAIMRDMPDRVFVDEEQRQRVLEAAQDTLDRLIDESEAE